MKQLLIMSKYSGDDVVVEEEIQEKLTLIQSYLKDLPDNALRLGVRVLFALIVLLVGIQLIKIVRRIVRRSLEKGSAEIGVIQFLDSFVKMALYAILIFMVAANFGMDATSILAILGSAGVAIGLALQGSLSNLAGGVLILLLKPFRIGDYIIEDSKENQGTVQEIQLFYTKLQTADGRIIVLPNGTLANTSLTNVSAATERRLEFKIGISYDSNIETVKEVMISIMKKDEAVIKEKDILAFVDSFGNSEVIMGGRCYVGSADYFPAKWRIQEEIIVTFEKEDILIPYQQLDVHVNQVMETE